VTHLQFAWTFSGYGFMACVSSCSKNFENCVCVQSAFEVLGEPDQESWFRLWRLQVKHCRLVPVRRGADIHGLLFHEWTQTQQRFAIQQTSICQRHSKVPQVGWKVCSVCSSFNFVIVSIRPFLVYDQSFCGLYSTSRLDKCACVFWFK